MYAPPYIFFHSRQGFRWKDGVDPTLKNLNSLNDASTDLLPSLTINVSQPNALLNWLNTNDASLITDLFIFVDAVVSCSPSPREWCLLFDKLRLEATNLRTVRVLWDADGYWGMQKPRITVDAEHVGLGRSVIFVRGLAQLKVKESLKISGLYAKGWPQYLEEKMGLKPIEDTLSDYDKQRLLDYQNYKRRLNPWVDTEDDSLLYGELDWDSLLKNLEMQRH
ncbi:MAG: hypothetical protein HETSPECPRED_010033 [Heterodermia speciosa]|uniref:Uncharacterized protein n=1 Tax=Heterodermia speciosa TaxID=116794 RepID=A0A8H3G4R4_9LECA|nr:MAG: hypothetical protein HETSPECPRED_010033 [Heterodermia speciosa]